MYRKTDNWAEENIQWRIDALYKLSDLLFVRTEEKDIQLKGIDLLVLFPNAKKFIACDEKMAAKYYFKDIGTFSFEVSTKSNIRQEGWLFSPDCITQAYLLIYVRAEDKYLTKVSSLEIIAVSKDKILEYLSENNLNSIEETKKIIEENGVLDENGRRIRAFINSDISVVQSIFIENEKPLNILITKKKLLELSFWNTKYFTHNNPENMT